MKSRWNSVSQETSPAAETSDDVRPSWYSAHRTLNAESGGFFSPSRERSQQIAHALANVATDIFPRSTSTLFGQTSDPPFQQARLVGVTIHMIDRLQTSVPASDCSFGSTAPIVPRLVNSGA
jgi:hypothetical protein